MVENPLFLEAKVESHGKLQGDESCGETRLLGRGRRSNRPAIIGFTWGGWVTGGHAKTLADAAVAVAATLVPICADKFQAVGVLALSTLKAEKDDRL
jgi:hypothetical protein